MLTYITTHFTHTYTHALLAQLVLVCNEARGMRSYPSAICCKWLQHLCRVGCMLYSVFCCVHLWASRDTLYRHRHWLYLTMLCCLCIHVCSNASRVLQEYSTAPVCYILLGLHVWMCTGCMWMLLWTENISLCKKRLLKCLLYIPNNIQQAIYSTV